MKHDFLSFGSDNLQTEIANLDRWVTYANLFGGSNLTAMFPRNQVLYPAFNGGVNAGPYTTPAADGAPWYEAGVPESEGFGGMWIQSVSGAGSTLSRSVFQGAGNGGSFGPGRLGPRTMLFTGWLVGAGELQLDYGFEWLTQILMGKCLDPNDVTSARWFAGDPHTRTCGGITDLLVGAGGDPFGVLRKAYDVYLTGPPTVIRRHAVDGCFSMYQITFELSFGSPYVYANGCAVIDTQTLIQGLQTVELPCCDETPGFVPPCYAEPFDPADLTRDNCWRQPLSVFRSVVQIDPVGSRRFSPLVTVNAGPGFPTTDLRVVFYERRAGDPAYNTNDPTNYNDLYECQRKMAAIEIPYMPADSVLTLDGATNTVQLTLDDGTVVNRQIAQGESGGPLSVPSSDGCSSMVVVVEADSFDASLALPANPLGTAIGGTFDVERCDQFLTAGGA